MSSCQIQFCYVFDIHANSMFTSYIYIYIYIYIWHVKKASDKGKEIRELLYGFTVRLYASPGA